MNESPENPASTSPVPSPCIKVCRIDPESGLCEGCLRSLEEISAWPYSSDAEKHAVLARIEERRKIIKG